MSLTEWWGKNNLIRALNVSLEEHDHRVAKKLSRCKVEPVTYFECASEECLQYREHEFEGQ